MRSNPALLLLTIALGAWGAYTLFFATEQPPTKWRIMRDPAPAAVQQRAMQLLGQWTEGREWIERTAGQWVKYRAEWHPPDTPIGPNVWHHGISAYETA